jgi:hypothetical protein
MAGYIGNIPVPQGTQTRQNFTATASQTSFPTIGYTTGFIDVYLNGVKLINGTDFTATNGSDVVLASAASASDVLDVVIFDTFDTSSGTFSDTTLKNNVTLKNDTHEDSDGGRASKIIYQGEQSGGEISTLAEIQASHDGTSDDQKGDLIFKTNDGSDNNAPTEAMRIDSSRNVLIGKDNTTLSNAGIATFGAGLIEVSRSASKTMTLNRLSDDGEILNLRKDGTTVGSLGAHSSQTFIGTGDTGLYFNAGNDSIDPYNTSTPINRDNAISIGAASRRFKDLYLSGGAYLGGTGAANKLEDYEEGIAQLTITTGSGTIGLANGGNGAYYTKIGRLVTIGARLDVASTSSPSGQLYITGLPFVGLFDHDTAGQNAVTVIIFSPSTNLEYNLCGEITNTHTTSILLRDKMGFTGGVAAVADHIDSGSLIAFTATYVAAS